MPFSWTFEHGTDHLAVRVDGDYQIQSTLKLLEEIRTRSRESGHRRVFCDVRGVRGQVPENDRFVIGAQIASLLGSTKFAVVVAADAFVTGFAVNVAARRGGRMFVTKDVDEARQWLFADETPG